MYVQGQGQLDKSFLENIFHIKFNPLPDFSYHYHLAKVSLITSLLLMSSRVKVLFVIFKGTVKGLLNRKKSYEINAQ